MTDTTTQAPSDEQLAAIGITREQYQQLHSTAPAAAAQPYAGPPGAGQLAAPLAPPPPPEPPKLAETPHPEETFAPGELAVHEYQHPADKPGDKRQQVVMVTHTDDTHVHGLVLGELRNVASFLKGQLTRGAPADPPAAT